MRGSSRSPVDTPSELTFVTIRPGGGGLPALAMDLGAMEKLRIAAIEGLKAIPRRGLEVGGILVGRVANPASHDVAVSITEFIAVLVSHRTGPSFNLDESDIALMHRTIREVEQREGETNELVLGWWRTDTRSGALKRSLEDDETMRQIFGPGPALLLQIRPSILDDFTCLMHVLEANTWHSSEEFSLTPLATVQQPEQGIKAPEPPKKSEPKPDSREALPEVSRKPAQADSDSAATVENADPDAEGGPDPAQPAAIPLKHDGQNRPERASIPTIGEIRAASVPPAERRASRQMPIRRVLAFVVLASISFLVIFAIVLYGRGWWRSTVAAMEAYFPSAYRAVMGGNDTEAGVDSSGQKGPGESAAENFPVAGANTFPLQASAEKGGVRISWDPEVLPPGSADGGTIWVEDGNRETRIELSADEVAQGSLLYRPEADHIRIRARFGNGATAQFSALQVFGLEPAHSSEKRSRPVSERRVEMASGRPPRRPVQNSGPSRTFTPPGPDDESWQRNAPVLDEPAIQDSPASSGVPTSAVPIDSENTRLPVPAPPPSQPEEPSASATITPEEVLADCKPELQVLSYYERRSGFGILRGLQKLPFVPGGSEGESSRDLTAPVILGHSCPTRASVGNAIIPVSVEFLVEIGEDGRVDSAKSTGPAEYSAVATATRRLLRNWRFYPARVSGYAAKSEVRIRVEFPAARNPVPQN